MRLLSVQLQNFLSVESAQLTLDHRGLVHVEGRNEDDNSVSSNGAGKTSLIDAILWVLFGFTLRGYTADQVVARFAGKDCVGGVSFSVSNRVYTVQRFRKRSTTPTNGLRLFLGDDEITGASMAETQKMIEKIIGLSQVAFTQCVVFGQNEAYRFASLSDADKKRVLDDLLGVRVYAAAAKQVNEERKVMTKTVARLTAALVAAERAHQYAVTEQETASQEAAKWLKFAQGELEAKLLAVSQEIVTVKAAAKGERRLTAQLTGLTETMTALNEERARESRVTLAAKTDRVAEERSLLKAEERQARASRLKKGDCSTCGQEITAASLATQQRLQAQDIQRLKKRIHTATLHSNKRDEIDQDVQARAEALTDQIDDVTTKLFVVGRAKKDVKILEKNKKSLQATVLTNPHRGTLVRGQLRELHTRLEVVDLTDQVDAAETQERDLRFWEEGFGTKGIRSLMLDSVLPFLNKTVAEYSDKLTDGTLSIAFDTETKQKGGKYKEAFSVQVDNDFGAGDYAGLSMGERSKVDLCVGLSLQDLARLKSATPLNFAFFDEPFERLDPVACDRVIELLTGKLKRETMFVVTHNESLKAHFNNTITVVKKNGKSYIE